jgi:predicted HicB family RNase H-like nuclease
MQAMAKSQVDISHYTYRVTWSPEDGEYVGTCVELPSVSWLAGDAASALTGIGRVVADVAADMAASGEELPQPFSERAFSGKFQVRVSPDLHRRLTTRAAEQKLSLNRYVEERLAASV